jgi:DNA-binding transcriptional MerR regulator
VATITFDTLKFVHRLRDLGMPESQAEAIAEAFREASGEADLPTKDDLKLAVAELRTELHKEMRDLKVDLIKWMTGALIAQAAVIATLVKLL